MLTLCTHLLSRNSPFWKWNSIRFNSFLGSHAYFCQFSGCSSVPRFDSDNWKRIGHKIEGEDGKGRRKKRGLNCILLGSVTVFMNVHNQIRILTCSLLVKDDLPFVISQRILIVFLLFLGILEFFFAGRASAVGYDWMVTNPALVFEFMFG